MYNSLLVKIIREPFIHFLIIGVAIFVSFEILSDRENSIDEYTIVLSADQLLRLENQLEETLGRKPVSGELDEVIDDFILEEMYVREALKLGLDEQDPVIRKRLEYKMTFLATSSVTSTVPEEGELLSYYNKNQEHFSQPDEISFEEIPVKTENWQLYLATLRGDSKHVDQLLQNKISTNVRTLSYSDIRSSYGADFHQAIGSYPKDQWSGPIQSTKGLHLIRILEITHTKPPEFSDIKFDVLNRWRLSNQKRLSEKFEEKLFEKYQLIVPSRES